MNKDSKPRKRKRTTIDEHQRLLDSDVGTQAREEIGDMIDAELYSLEADHAIILQEADASYKDKNEH